MTRLLAMAAAAALSLAATASAQTWTSCNPLNTTCAPDTALGVSNYSINFIKNMATSRVWNATAGSVGYVEDGATFVINEQGDAPTIQSNFHLFFGQVEVIMKAAAGQGIVSSIVLESDDLDEVDWEWIGGNDSYVQTNYFGKGNTTTYDRAKWYPVSNTQGEFHNYTTDWSAEKLDWYIDGNIVRTLHYEDANGGKNFPQTPCNVRIGVWAGGQAGNNNWTVEWAGGPTDFSKAPFVMTVQSVRVSDASTGTQYEYTDHSGDWQSIKALNTTAALVLDGNNGPNSESTSQKWRGLSTGAKIGIVAGVAGLFAIIACVFLFCCLKQRRAGKHERLLEDAKYEKERNEMMAARAEFNRQRTEKMAHGQVYAVPGGYDYNMAPQNGYMMGNAGVQVMPGVPSVPSVHSGSYAHSMASSGRGFQRY